MLYLKQCPICDKKFEAIHTGEEDGTWSHVTKWACNHTEEEYREALDKAEGRFWDISMED